MYKEIVISSIIIIVIIILNIFTQNYTKETVFYMDDKLQQLEKELIKEEVDGEKVLAEIDHIMQEWKKRYQKLAYFIEHDELEKVETELTGLQANIGVGEYEQSIQDLKKSIFILNHIKDKFSLQIKNIF